MRFECEFKIARQPISSATSTFGTVLTSTFLFDGGIIAQNNSVSKAGFSG